LILATAFHFSYWRSAHRISIVDPLANMLGCFSQGYYWDKYK